MVAEPGADVRSHALASGFAVLTRGVVERAGVAVSAEEYGWAGL